MLTSDEKLGLALALEESAHQEFLTRGKVNDRPVDDFLIALAGNGLLVEPINKPKPAAPAPLVLPPNLAAALMPHGSVSPHALHAPAPKAEPPTPTGPLGTPNKDSIVFAGQPPKAFPTDKLTPRERGIVRTVEAAYEAQRGHHGYTFKAENMKPLLDIIARLTGPQ